ncbi:ATP-binding cassette domain-containing protein [Streptomyces niphimycinicus]|uniref:ATP-binding cassette domain-containing protein n=1 Tax=Streptomyces niphimycinicus TaxID=2842201 RepID=UPI0035586555
MLRVPELALYSGTCLAVVGRSGSGKTTLARCLAGLHRDHEAEGIRAGSRRPYPGDVVPRGHRGPARGPAVGAIGCRGRTGGGRQATAAPTRIGGGRGAGPLGALGTDRCPSRFRTAHR